MRKYFLLYSCIRIQLSIKERATCVVRMTMINKITRSTSDANRVRLTTSETGNMQFVAMDAVTSNHSHRYSVAAIVWCEANRRAYWHIDTDDQNCCVAHTTRSNRQSQTKRITIISLSLSNDNCWRTDARFDTAVVRTVWSG